MTILYNGKKIDVSYNDEFEIIGPNLKKVVTSRLKSIAESSFNVLITGENGTGKELVARYISKNNGHINVPFEIVNISALTPTLFEDELFGHVKNAFTGARTSRIGLLKKADKGILFLDEIGDLVIGAQTSLLRFLGNGEVKPIGSNETFNVDVRVISATNVNLDDALYKKQIREDLFYRLNQLSFKTPPLRENREDIPYLLSYFINKYANNFPKKILIEDIPPVNASIVQLLKQFEWSGNTRELENQVKRYVTFNEQLELIPSEYADFVKLLGHNNKMNDRKMWSHDRMLKIVAYNYCNIAKQYLYEKGSKNNLSSILQISEKEVTNLYKLNRQEKLQKEFYGFSGLKNLFNKYAHNNLSMSYVLTRFFSAHVGVTIENENGYEYIIDNNIREVVPKNIKFIYHKFRTNIDDNKIQKIMDGKEELRLSNIIPRPKKFYN
jgi:transcriptional regulator with PAS, ATPase and Fis domain